MTNNNSSPINDLRGKAEVMLKSVPETAGMLPVENVKEILHELQVHQIELELQNEELRHTRQALEESRTRYMRLYHDAPVGYVVLNGSGIITQANTTFSRMLQRDRDKILGRPFSDYLAAEDRQIFLGRAKAFFKNPTNKCLELRLETAASQPCHVSLRAAHSQDATANVGPQQGELFLTVTDITNRKQLEEKNLALQHQVDRQEKDESLGRMAGAIAHHFNNLLFVILGNIELALEDAPRFEGLIRSLNHALDGTNRAAEISGRMLTYLGMNTKDKKEVDLSVACRQGLALLLAVKPEKAVIEATFPASGPTIIAELSQVHEILAILAENAWEATERIGGLIRLSISTTTARHIAEKHRYPLAWKPQNGTFACLEVADNGCGIADGELDKIFDPFYTNKFTGRGMGLAMVLGILRAHDGCITADSSPGRGTTFRAYFPLQQRDLS